MNEKEHSPKWTHNHVLHKRVRPSKNPKVEQDCRTPWRCGKPQYGKGHFSHTQKNDSQEIVEIDHQWLKGKKISSWRNSWRAKWWVNQFSHNTVHKDKQMETTKERVTSMSGAKSVSIYPMSIPEWNNKWKEYVESINKKIFPELKTWTPTLKGYLLH